MDGLRAKLEDALVDCHINAGSVLMLRTDFQGALGEANAALAIEPKSSATTTFRARVLQGSSEASAWGGRVIWR